MKECLVYFGPPAPSSGFGSYRLWLTQAALEQWTNQPVLSNLRIDGTLVLNESRVIYNVGARYSGNPEHQHYDSPMGVPCHYAIDLPADDMAFGADSLSKLRAPGDVPFDDETMQREQTVNWMARQVGLPAGYKRYVRVYVNGAARGLLEDTQVPNSDFVDQFYPNDEKGEILKLQPWSEFTLPAHGAGAMAFTNGSFCTLNAYTTPAGKLDPRRYRWNWQLRGSTGPTNDYATLGSLIELANQDAGRSIRGISPGP